NLLFGLKITFLNQDLKSVHVLSEETLLVKGNTIDVHFTLSSELIRYVILEGKVIKEVCSLWISFGQNTALRTNAFYSSPKLNRNDTQYLQAVDGNLPCPERKSSDGGTLWTIIMDTSYTVLGVFYFLNDTI
ncbi:hypothetical protein BgiMline_014375, partial [Biomphalaria glabrata]